MHATQRARLHLASRIEQRKDDWEWLDKLWAKQPETNHRHPFGLNKQIIVAEKLFGLSREGCSELTQAMIHGVETDEVKNLLAIYLHV